MKVAIVSDFNPRFPHGLEGSYARAFEARGHTVFPISLHAHFSVPIRMGRLAGYVGPVLHQAALLRDVREHAPHLVVLVKAMGVLESTVQALRADGARVVNVFPDNPFDAMAVNPLGGLLLSQFRALSAVFVHDRFAVAQLRRLGIAARFLAFARDPLIQHPGAWGDALPDAPELVFVGNPDSERIRYLRAVQDLGLGLWGNWHLAKLAPDDPLSRCVRGGELTGADMVRTMHGGKLSINVLRGSQKTAHNMRTFESPACGVCTLSEASPGVLELMEDGKEVVSFSSPAELRERARFLLAHRKEREAIAHAGWKRVESDGYRERVETLLRD